MRWTLSLLTALTLLLTACSGDQSSTTAVDDGADAVELSDSSPPPAPADAPTATSEGAASPSPRSPEALESPQAPEATTGSGDPDRASTTAVIDVRADHPVTAQPGRWAAGEAGFVEFDLTDGGLTLIDVTENEGWTSRIDEDDRDEIEVDFTRGATRIQIEIEWDGGELEIDIATDIDPAEPGVYDLGRAGSVEFARDGERLSLIDVVVADGWDLRIDDESDEEIEFELRSGAERWDVEIELDDGRIEVEIDYRVRSAPGR
jgi:hypothetical protein